MASPDSESYQNTGFLCLIFVEILSIIFFFYGVSIVLFFASVVIFVRRGFSNRATAAMFTVIVINFLIGSLDIGIQLTQLVGLILVVLDLPKPRSRDDLFWNTGLAIGGRWAQYFPILLSDLVVIWRAWALFLHHRWVILVPSILWLGAVGTTVAHLTGSLTLATPSAADWETDGVFGHPLFTASLTLSIATNAVTTSMIAYTLWGHRKFILEPLGLSRRKSPVQNILILLVESGLVYLGFQVLKVSLCQITYLILNAYGNHLSYPSFALYGVEAIFYSLGAMYPILVIVMVETQRSMVDMCEISPFSASRVAGPASSLAVRRLSCAVGPIHSAMGNKSEFLHSRGFKLQTQDGQDS